MKRSLQMSPRTIFTAAMIIGLAAGGHVLGPGSQLVLQAQRPSATADVTHRAMAAAEAFLATLDSAKRAKANIDLNAKTRTIWSNLPTGVAMQVGATERNGLKLGDMSPAQEKAALALVASTLSTEGFRKAMAIVDADQILETRSAPSRSATT